MGQSVIRLLNFKIRKLIWNDYTETMTTTAIFHLAIPISNVAQAKEFYAENLGCAVGRENNSAVIFNFYGTQLVAHVTQAVLTKQTGIYPRHFGLILPTQLAWQQLCDRAQAKNITFYHAPKLRFPHQELEHHCFFLEDPFYNLLEFKHYSQPEVIFGGTQSSLIGDTVATNN
jgi:uncharacterized protein